MNLLSANQANINPGNIIYKNSPFWAFVAFLVVTAFLATPVVLWAYGRLPVEFVYFSGFFLFILSIVYFKSFLKTLKPDNWVVSLSDKYMLIKFRSYMNVHLPKEDLQIAQLEYREIVSFFIGKKTRITPMASGGKRYEFIKYIDLHLKCNTDTLKAQLNDERNMNRVSRALQFYVFVTSEKTIRIHWLDTQTVIRPNLKHIAGSLVAQGVHQIRDVSFFKKASTVIFDEDRDILELYDNGYEIEAISLARRMYGIGLTEAKLYVNKLSNANK